MLVPQIPPPFPLRWGFTTKLDPAQGLPPVRLKQVHGCSIWKATSTIQQGDGLWTIEPHLPIGVRVADCVPVLLAGLAQGRPWVAALHAGWRSAVAGILRQGVTVFREQGGHPADLVWSFGPSIQRCHFEVGDEVIEAAAADPAWRAELGPLGPHGRPHLDLHGLLRAQARDEGLDPAREASIPLCTVCQTDLLFSYRRGDMSNRQWGWIEILEASQGDEPC